MALTYLKNVKATRVFYNGLGVEFTESFQKQDGSTGTTKYTAWFQEDPGIAEGAVGNVSGLTGVKARIWTPEDGEARAVADIVLNSARFEAVDETADAADTPF